MAASIKCCGRPFRGGSGGALSPQPKTGGRNPFLGKALPRMEENFPKAPVTQTDAGHFLQEEVPDEIAQALIRVLSQVKE